MRTTIDCEFSCICSASIELCGTQFAPFVQNVYQNQDMLLKNIRQAPAFAGVENPEWAFKIRDKENPDAWKDPVDLTILPAEEDVPQGVLGNFKATVSSLIPGAKKK